MRSSPGVMLAIVSLVIVTVLVTGGSLPRVTVTLRLRGELPSWAFLNCHPSSISAVLAISVPVPAIRAQNAGFFTAV